MELLRRHGHGPRRGQPKELQHAGKKGCLLQREEENRGVHGGCRGLGQGRVASAMGKRARRQVEAPWEGACCCARKNGVHAMASKRLLQGSSTNIQAGRWRPAPMEKRARWGGDELGARLLGSHGRLLATLEILRWLLLVP
ncbi:hypothetical protein Zm00014a_039964 [Zea mays]|uniref:Uncharacterized protein n=1 Tax=Zea mays TaxID=4577 RepID=A0A3L6ESM9_MAIZE|nr:hypothetical protein Zm00014a_039964 [Zea mays]